MGTRDDVPNVKGVGDPVNDGNGAENSTRGGALGAGHKLGKQVPIII